MPLAVQTVEKTINKIRCGGRAIVNHFVALLLNNVRQIGHSLFNVKKCCSDTVRKALVNKFTKALKQSGGRVNFSVVRKLINNSFCKICRSAFCGFNAAFDTIYEALPNVFACFKHFGRKRSNSICNGCYHIGSSFCGIFCPRFDIIDKSTNSSRTVFDVFIEMYEPCNNILYPIDKVRKTKNRLFDEVTVHLNIKTVGFTHSIGNPSDKHSNIVNQLSNAHDGILDEITVHL